MKKDQNKLDKLFNDKLQGKKFEANDSDWTEVEGMLNERDRTGFFLNLFNKRFYILLAFLGLLGVSSIFYFSNNDTGKLSSNSQLVDENENYNNSMEVNEAIDLEIELKIEESSPDLTSNYAMSNNKVNAPTISSQENELTSDLINETQERTKNIVSRSDEILTSGQDNDVNNSKVNSTSNEALNDELNSASVDNAKNLNVNGTEQRTAPANGSMADDMEENSMKVLADKQNEASNRVATTDPKLENSQPELILDEQNEIVVEPFNDLGSGSALDDSKENSNSDEKENVSAIPTIASDTSGNKGAENLKTSEENNPGNLIANDAPNTEALSSEKPSGLTTDEQNGNRIMDGPEDALKDSSLIDTKSNGIIKASSLGGISIGMTLASAFVSKNMKANGAMNDEYLQRRENEESSTVNFHAGINASFHFNHLLLSTGLDYATYSEKIEYKPESKYVFVDSTISAEIVDSVWSNPGGTFGQWIYIYDSVWVVNTNVIDSINVNVPERNGKTSWRYLEVPVMVWYRMDKEKYVIDGGIGGSVGMLQKVNSYYLNTELTNLENIDASGNYRDIVYNIMLATRFSYKLDANWLIGVDLRYKQNITSVFKSDYPVEQRYKSFNTGLSIMYRLNSKK